MKKKILLTLIALLSILYAHAAYDFQSGDLYYNITSSILKTAEVVGNKSHDGLTSITIPTTVTYNGTTYSVTSIGNIAFYNRTGLTSITIPNSVTSIGEWAFYRCTGLTSITIPESVTSIGSDAFINTAWYNNQPDGVIYINKVLYKYKGTMPQGATITVEEGTIIISDYAFYGCTGLTSITIPNSVTSIGSRAFYGFTSTSITIPNSVTTIGNTAFYNVPCIAYNGSAPGSPWGARSVNGYVDGYFVYANATKTTLLACSSAAAGAITIPNSVTSIGSNAFCGCTGLTSISIPESVTSIGDDAFYKCTGLTAITIPNSVTSIGNWAFYGCTGLTSVTIGNSVTSIGRYAFDKTAWYNNQADGVIYISKVLYKYKGTMPQGTTIAVEEGTIIISDYAFSRCTGLTSVTIPDGVTSIGERAFDGCTSTSITIPNSVTSIGEYAFDDVPNVVYNGTATGSPWGAKSVNGYVDGYWVYADATKTTLLACSSAATGAITIPNSVTSIGTSAFRGCTSLTSVTIGNSVTSIGRYAFSDCTGLTSITIPNSVTSIGDATFSRCTGLTSVTIGNSVTSIGRYAFSDCTGLTSITIPNSVTSIGDATFSRCTGLTSVTIGNSVKSIGDYAFYKCTALTSIRVKAKTPPQCNDNTFFNVPEDIPVYVACDKEAYQNCAGWSSFTNIIEEREYRVTIRSSANGSAEMLSYTCDNELTVQATANEHYHFTQWSDGNTDNLRTFVVFQDTTLTANFAIDQHSISATAENGRIEGAGIYNYGTRATLTAIANEHYHFTQWSDGNTDNPRTITVEGNATYTTVFAIDQHTISASAENGRIEGAGAYDYGTTAILTAIADEHYHFTQWSDGNTDNPRIVSVHTDSTYTAEFAPNPYNISTSATNGRVEGAGEYDYGTTATLIAIADEHYHFAQWSDGNTNNPRTITIKGDATYTAEFAIDRHTITTTCDIRYGEVTGDGVYDYGTRITLTAIPNSGYEFKQWSNGLTYNPYRFTVLEDLSLEAVFVSSAATAIENTEIDTATPQKVLINGQVYILRNGKTYTTTGVEVE